MRNENFANIEKLLSSEVQNLTIRLRLYAAKSHHHDDRDFGRVSQPYSSPESYPGIHVALISLPTCPVSTLAAEHNFSGMKRLTSPFCSTMVE